MRESEKKKRIREKKRVRKKEKKNKKKERVRENAVAHERRNERSVPKSRSAD